MGSPIRKSSDQSLFAAPRRLSQRITSFIACHCQGIHQMLLLYLIHLSCLSYRTKKLYTIRIKTIPCYLFASTQNYYVCCVTVQTTHTIMLVRKICYLHFSIISNLRFRFVASHRLGRLVISTITTPVNNFFRVFCIFLLSRCI